MDLTNSTVKTPEAETETPTPIHLANKPTPFNTNGVLKRHAPLHHHHAVVVTYKECLRNHAASLGGHAVDGCGEFMPSPTTNPTDPSLLKCAACGCHRNFHRREPDDTLHHLSPPSATPALEYHPHHRHHPPPPPRVESGDSPNNSPSPPPISSAYYPSAPHMLLANSHSKSAPPPDAATVAAPVFTSPNTNSTPIFSSGSGRKRFRTRFTQEQKEKMLELAERVGWKMQKRDDDVITEFCSKIGVEKGVFKVWMHNNKHNFGKKDQISPGNGTAISTPIPTATGNGSTVSYNNIGYLQEGNREIKDNFHGQELNQNQLGNNDNNDNRTHLQVLGANGSSSSC